MQNHDSENLLGEFAASRKLDWTPTPGFADRVKAGLALESAASSKEAHPAPRPSAASILGSPLEGFHATGKDGRRSALARLLEKLASPRNLGVAFASIALAAGALVWRAKTAAPLILDESGITRVKGEEFRLGFLAGGPVLAEVAPGQSFRAGDRLQPLYSSAREGFIALFSIDEVGTVTSYSEGPGHASPPAQGRTLPYAVELDGSSGGELFIAIRTDVPADRRKVESELRSAWEANGRKLEGMRPSLGRAGFTDARISTFQIGKQGGML
ncbi:MAG: hypothetical protein JWP91_346 [Fibrobacteres bacterium]|nr:hypothetical protein [Fibrobacterota bacterium]